MRKNMVQKHSRKVQKTWVTHKRSILTFIVTCIALLCMQAGFIFKAEFGTTSNQMPYSKNLQLPSPHAADVPLAPVLDTIKPNPDYDTNVFLSWNAVAGATSYKVYRDTAPITTIGSLTPVVTPTNNFVADQAPGWGIWWYAVVASNASGDSGLSNTLSTTLTYDPAVVFYTGFDNDTSGIPPAGWTAYQNLPTYMFFRVNVGPPSPTLSVGDNQAGDSVYGYTNFASSFTSGNLSFDLFTSSADGGSSPQVYYVYLQTSGGSPVIMFKLEDWKATHTCNMTLGTTLAPTTFLELAWYHVLIQFDGTTMSLTVNDTTWLTGISYGGGTIQRFRIETTTASYGGGTEFDNILVMRVTTPPSPPTLSSITPNPSINGSINLVWSSSPGTSIYYVFRNTSIITDVSGLTPILTTAATSGLDTVVTDGTYYYVVVAGNIFGNSSISNCQSVIATLAPPTAPTLSTILPNPSNSGSIYLVWTSSSGAGIYYVYRNTSTITNISGLTPIIMTSSTSGNDKIASNGTYYYVVVAGNAYGNSSISNCESVVVSIVSNETLFFDDFESGTGNWESITGLWHLTDDSSAWPNPYHSYRTSMWFGQESTGDYNTGARVTGAIVTKPIDLTTAPGAYLDFYHWRTTENLASYDISYVRVSTDDVTWNIIYQTGNNLNPWNHQILNISNYCGNATVWIKFDFDSIDSIANNYRGWLVDDVQVYTKYIPPPPAAPTLSAITPNPNYSGTINLAWNSSPGATIYYVYRDTSVITSTVGLTPVLTTASTSGVNTVGTPSTYYYVVVAGNANGNSSISNCQSVVVSLPATPTLSAITPNPSINGSINLAWSSSTGATIYYVYRDTSVITSTLGLTPVLSTAGTSGQDAITSDNTYYYVVVAGSAIGNSSISNCRSVIVSLTSPAAPTLSVITPNPNTSGIINLAWSSSSGASIYYVYRDTSVITSTAGLTPILTTASTSGQNIVAVIGTYYYVVVAGNWVGNSSISNCQSVVVNPPAPPTLSAITPNPSINGSINLAWSSSTGATIYYVYRDTTVITSTAGLTPILSTAGTSSQDAVTSDNTYYYVVVAGNALGNSSISNYQSIDVILSAPTVPTLSVITPNPNTSGIINLVWSSSPGAGIYYVYRNTSTITDISGLTPVLSTTSTSGQNIATVNGTYYYVVVAGNWVGNSSISNCQSVVVNPPSPPTLSAITPNPSTTSVINLAWSSSTGATIYYVYRDTSVITSTVGLTPVLTTASTSGQNIVTINGTYYYVVVAGNTLGNSSISNCRSVIVNIPRNYTMLVGAAAYNWIDAIVGGTQLFLSNDGTSAQNLPFSFTFYDQTFSRVYVSANGWMSFVNTNPYQYNNVPYPSSSSSYAYAIAPYWDDLYPGGSGNQVYVKNGTDYWVMAWINVMALSGPTVGTFEVVLYANGTILLQYDHISYVGSGYTCGLNYGDGYFGSVFTGLTATTTALTIIFSNVPPGISHPNDFEFAYGTTGHSISWTITDLFPPTPSYTIYCNGSFNASGSWAGAIPITINVDNLSVGWYYYTIIASNGRGDSFQDEVWVTVRNMLITHPMDVIYPERSIGHTLVWIVTVGYNATTFYSILSNDTEIDSGSWTSGIEIPISIDGLRMGCYNISIIVTDGLGNYTQDDVIVIVIPNVSHLAVTNPLDRTYTTIDFDKFILWTVFADNFADGIYTIYQNGINVTNGTWIAPKTYLMISVSGLSVGGYNFTLVLTDCWGVTIQDEVDITIMLPTSNLQINALPDLTYVQNSEGNFFKWVIYAENTAANGSYNLYLDGNLIDSGTWQAPGRSLNVNVDGLAPGQHMYKLVLEDCWGARVERTVSITVNPVSNPILDQFIPYLIAVGIGLAATLILYAIIRRRSKAGASYQTRKGYKFSSLGGMI